MSDKAIQNRANEVLKERLSNNKINDDLKDLESDTNQLCQERLKMCKKNKSKPWDIDDLKHVLKKLGRDKARDADGLANELFTLEVAGDDLLEALLKLLNLIKEKQKFPEAQQKCIITTLYKKKARKFLRTIEESSEFQLLETF